jgi:Zn-dependent protease with chaperone function
MRKPTSPNYYFWLLLGLSLLLIGFGVILSWSYSQRWLNLLWQACQNGLSYLAGHPSMSWRFVVPIVILVVVARAGISLIEQIKATRRLSYFFLPFRETPPARLQRLLYDHAVPLEDVVFLKLAARRAFCLGFWRPRIWLTAGLVELLSDQELAAVVAHEVYHYRRRDPLRLLIGRALQSAFFFLPLMADLARASEIHQEVAADQLAVRYLGDDLPLLCALQKLLQQSTPGRLDPMAAYNSFNVTEARLQRLIYPATPIRWGNYAIKFLVNLAIILSLGSTLFLSSAQPVANQTRINACLMESFNASQSPLPPLQNYTPAPF